MLPDGFETPPDPAPIEQGGAPVIFAGYAQDREVARFLT
jgi:hypothetical protein